MTMLALLTSLVTIYAQAEISPIFIEGRDCRAILQDNRFLCESKDCRALLLDNRYLCESKNCKALITDNRYLCSS